MHAYRRTAIVLTGVLALLLAACTRVLNTEEAEKEIRRGLQDKTGVSFTSVDCPRKRKIREGDTFECRAEASDGGTLEVAVEQTDSRGGVEWHVERGLVEASEVEDQVARGIREQQGMEATVDCGASAIVARKGDSFDCAVRAPTGDLGAVTVTVEDDEGNFTWRLAAD